MEIQKQRKSKKICFVGGPGTGKTVLAKSLVGQLQKEGYKAELAKEYARDFIINFGPMRDAGDQLLILQGQREREKKAEEKNPDFVVSDCATYLAYVYSFLYKPSVPQELKKYRTISKTLLRDVRKDIYNYDHVFFLPIEFPPPEDGTRLYVEQASDISKQIKKFLNNHKITHHQIKGNLKERLDKVMKIININ